MDLAAAHQNAGNFTVGSGIRILMDALKTTRGKIVQIRNDTRMTQQAFGCHHDQRFSPPPQDLPSQTVKELRRSGWLDDLNIVLGRQFEKPLQPGAGVFRALSFHAVWQKERDAAEPPPLIFSRRDELIYDHLCGVPEIPKLSLPRNKAVRSVEAVAVLETEHARLRQRTVVDLYWSLLRGKVLIRSVSSPIFHIV